MADSILIITLNTTHCTATIFNKKGQISHHASQRITMQTTLDNTQGIDPQEIIYSVRSAIHQMTKTTPSVLNKVMAIGLCTQSGLGLIWDSDSGQAAHPIILDTSEQSSRICQKLQKQKLNEDILTITGLKLNTRYPAPNFKWLSEHHKKTRTLLRKKTAIAGTVDSWLLYHLSNKRILATDITNADQSMLMDSRDCSWSSFLKTEFGLKKTTLPAIHPSKHLFGHTENFHPLPDGIPITSVCTEHAAKLLGMNIHQFGQATLSYGRHGHFQCHSRKSHLPIASPLRYCQHAIHEEKYIESDIIFPQALTKWIPTLNIISNPHEAANYTIHANTNNDIHIIPSLERIPILGQFNPSHQLAILGIGADTREEHIIRAYFEAVAFQVKSFINSIDAQNVVHMSELAIDGPLSKNTFLCQFQADILQVPIITFAGEVSEQIGAALLNAESIGNDFLRSQLQKNIKIKSKYLPDMDPISSHARFKKWERLKNDLTNDDML